MDANGKFKFVALVNKNLEPGVAMNALGHMALGLAARLADGRREDMKFLDFIDRDGQTHPNISGLSLIVLRGTSGNVRTLRNEALAAQLPVVDFTSTMTGDTYVEQLERTRLTLESDLDYYGVMLFGPADQVAPLTRKYSLYR